MKEKFVNQNQIQKVIDGFKKYFEIFINTKSFLR